MHTPEEVRRASKDWTLHVREKEMLLSYAALLEAGTLLTGATDDIERRLREAEQRAEKAEANYRFMVERAADEKLDGYRELGERAATAELRAERAEAEARELREALTEWHAAMVECNWKPQFPEERKLFALAAKDAHG